MSYSVGRTVRLAVVLSHPTQYYSPWFRWIAANSEIDLRVFYLWDFGVKASVDPGFGKAFSWDVDLLSGYESEFVPNVSRKPGAEHFLGFNNPEITGRLASWAPDVLLLFGYNYLTHIRVIAWARRAGVPLIFRGDSHFLGRGRPKTLKGLVLRTLYAQFRAFLYVGAANKEYFETLGVSGHKLFFSPHCVDSKHFDPSNTSTIQSSKALREQLGIAPDKKVILFAGKLIPAKQPFELLDAFLKLNSSDAELVFVGDGSERDRLVDRAKAKGKGSVHFLPFANQSEMPIRLKAADVFVLPSRGLYETWGLAVNEAMHMGVPCLVSDRVGCQRDLVQDGVTGWVFNSDDPQALENTLATAIQTLRDRDKLKKIIDSVFERISGYTYQRAAEGLIAALASVSQH